MWFQGRDEEIEDEVVSLSTGRIYKASSPDGLKWTLEEGPGTRKASLDINEVRGNRIRASTGSMDCVRMSTRPFIRSLTHSSAASLICCFVPPGGVVGL